MKNITQTNHRGVNLDEPEAPLTNREAFLAAHPAARELHNAHMHEFREAFEPLVHGSIDVKAALDDILSNPKDALEKFQELLAKAMPLKTVFDGMVFKAENLRKVGIILLEWCEQSLPGGKLTRDLYEQHRSELTDARGQTASYEFLEAAIRTARENLAPIDNLHTALKYRQPLLLATGDAEFVLESVAPPQRAVPPPDPLSTLKKILNPADLTTALTTFRTNQNYFEGGKLRDSLRETLAEQLRPTKLAMDEFWQELGI